MKNLFIDENKNAFYKSVTSPKNTDVAYIKSQEYFRKFFLT